ncbi:MAG: FAD-linked oxidase C-terminal domain-containing protein, partial [Verrucomicrobiota bacterium]
MLRLRVDMLAALRDSLPDLKVLTDSESLYRASMDNLRISFLPEAVLKPSDESELQGIIEVANKHRIPLTPRGAGSATSGATAPVKGGWVVDLSTWDDIIIDPIAMMAFVGPGATITQIDDAAAEHGLFYPPDPGSKKYATIGGALACNAGGLRGAKYGVTRDYVLGLDGFLPTGEYVRWGGPLRKYVSGYNIKDLWLGSEGTLGFITRAVLRLIPAPQTKTTLMAAFDDESAALDTVHDILAARIIPSILEFLDQQSITCAHQFWENTEGSPDAEKMAKSVPKTPMLLIELDGSPDSVIADRKQIETLLDKRCHYRKEALSEEEAATIWKIRRGCSQAMFQAGDTKLNEDVVVPVESQQDLIEFTLKLKEEIGLATPTFGHAADGNFHVHIMYNYGDPDQKERAKFGIQKLMQTVIELGGVITGEHGVGLAKAPFMKLQHNPAEIDLMKRIKTLFDPNNIMNPGKQFEPFEMWEHKREDIRMPWDH